MKTLEVSLLLGIMCLSFCGCIRPQAVVDSAILTGNQLALVRIDAVAQMELLGDQRSRLAFESLLLRANQKAISEDISIRERDWRARGTKEYLELLNGIRQSDSDRRTDPYLTVRPQIVELAEPPKFDFSGLDKAISGISRLSDSRPFELEDIKPFIEEIAKAYDELAKQREEAAKKNP